MKNTLLKVIGVVLAIGCAPAGAVDPTSHSGTLLTTAGQPLLVASAVAYAPQGTSAGLAHAGNLQLPAGVNGPASLASHSQIALSTVPAPGNSRSSGTVDGRQGGGYLVSVAAVPEPSGGAMLLCGLAVLVFIARRKTQSVVD
jgi:hypothetical protein